MEGELLSTATDAGVFPVVSYSSVNWPGAMRATAISLPLGAVVCCFACLCLLYFSSSSSSSCVGILACCGRSSGAVCVWPLVRPPSPPLNVSFSLADIQFEWLAAAG